MPDAPAARPLAQLPWVDLLPWLDDFRHGPAILADSELIPNAWLDTSPAETLTADNFRRFCELVAIQYIRSRPSRKLATDFPALSTEISLADVDMGPRAETVLLTNQVASVDDLLQHTLEALLELRQVGKAIVTDIVTALIATTARAAGDSGENEFELFNDDTTVVSFIETLDERDRLVLRERILAVRPRTQVDLARQLGLSRERVNQLDRGLRMQLAELIDVSGRLRQLLAELLARANPVVDVERVLPELPALGALLPRLDVPVWRLLVAGSGAIDALDDAWIVKGTAQEANIRVREILADHAGPESVASIARVASDLGLPSEAAARWLGRTGFPILGEHVVTASASTSDLVAAALAIAGTPLTFDQIVTGVATMPRSRSSIRNALVTDDRIVKTDRTTYGLRRWGGDRYLPVHRQIEQILANSGGSIAITKLIAEISEKYDVSESSIRAYAGAGEFVTRNEVVTRRKKQYVHRKSPTKTRFLYRDGDIVRWRTSIAGTHTKGSAFNIPSALAGLVGVGPGNPVQLPSRLGTQSLIWVSVQARVGTIRRFVTDLDLTEGDEIFLEFKPDWFDVRRYVRTDFADPARQILSLLGLPDQRRVSKRDLLAILVSALWLPDGSDSDAVLAALRHRREEPLTGLVSSLFQ